MPHIYLLVGGQTGLLDYLHPPVPSAAGVAWAVQWSALL